MPDMLVRALAALAVLVYVGAPAAAQAQASPTPHTDVTNQLPSGTWLLVVVGLALAAYVSYRFGHKQAEVRRREGPVSKALGHGRGIGREHP